MRLNLRTIWVVLAASTTTAFMAAPAEAQPHQHDDIVVGRTLDGQLAAHFDWEEVHTLPAVSGLLQGWAADDPGFAHLEEDEPDENLYCLQEGVQVVFEVVQFDDAFKAWAPGFAAVLHDPGDSWLLGDEHLHSHLDWHIDSEDPLFEPSQEVWLGQFRLLDAGSKGYLPSEVYTLQFTTPEPGTLALAVVGVILAARRRRQ
ncbi:MAG TPA: PEP-CTERM sorting domain-containing protein [Phycisphaerae bacterium]|nr:PEP-CTERM sorting domain-containing protein [Phycisphaerae bacterium]HNU44131.1 PEP-CTERM sorting domain-containing protein [Phycisphaerae bacterium]